MAMMDDDMDEKDDADDDHDVMTDSAWTEAVTVT